MLWSCLVLVPKTVGNCKTGEGWDKTKAIESSALSDPSIYTHKKSIAAYFIFHVRIL